MKNIWKKLWGQALPPVDEVFPQVNEQNDSALDNLSNAEKFYRLYRRMEIRLFWRRFFVSLGLIVMGGFLLKGAFYAVKNNSFLACLGKEVCIVQGPKWNYPTISPAAILLKNGDVFVYHRRYLNSDLFPNYKEISFRVAEIYNKKMRKFEKIDDLRKCGFKSSFDNVCFHDNDAIDINSEGNILFIDRNKPIEIFDVKTKKFYSTKNNTFLNIKNLYVAKYNHKYALIISNNSRPDMLNAAYGFRSAINKKENLYLFNLDDFSLVKLPDFALTLKYYPVFSDFIILDNGKIIMPVRFKYKPEDEKTLNAGLSREHFQVDHIEIYDPVQNKFFAETNKDVMKDNIFHMVLENGDVLFINKKSTYIFVNNLNKFVEADIQESIRNAQALEEIDILLNSWLDMYLEELLLHKARVIKLAPEKVLITCGKGHYFNFPPHLSDEVSEVCRRTVYYDHKKQIVKKGPTFVDKHLSSTILKIDKNTFFVLGGREYGEFGLKRNNGVQIIKVNN